MAKKSTFIKLDRNITRWRWYTDPNTFRVFIHLLLNANVTEADFEEITIHRGELATSYRSLSKELSIPVQGIRTAIKHLVETGEVTQSGYAKFTVFAIVNYDSYQSRQQAANSLKTADLTECSQFSPRTSTGTLTGKSGVENTCNSNGSGIGQTIVQQSNQHDHQQSTNRQPTGNQQQLKNNKELKNKKNIHARETDPLIGSGPPRTAPRIGETVYFTNYRGERIGHVWREKDAVRFKQSGLTDVEQYILEMT